MDKSEKEILAYQLAQEQEVLKKLESQYKRALNDIIRKTKIIQADIDMLQEAINANGDDEVLLSMHRSKVYQKQYQDALQGQIAAILENLHTQEYATIQAYLNGCYEAGFVGALYEIQSQGVPLIFPIDQSQVVQAIQLETKLSVPLYERLGADVSALKKTIQGEVSRGIATSLPYAEIARNISNAANVPRYNAMRIARTEGGRIQNKAAFDVAEKAKKAGADVVKQWSAALDARTRPSHARLDGEVRELEEKFSNGLMYPKDPSGSAGEVVNCRCRMKEVPRWALDSESTKRLGNTDNMTDEQLQPLADKLGISVEELRKYKNNIIPVKAKDYDDFRRQYEKIYNANAVSRANPIANSGKSGKINSGAKGAYTSKNDPDFKKRDAHAEKYYSGIRNSDKESIVNTISKNSGIEKDEVNKMVNHLFYSKHNLDKGFVYFDSDYDISESVRRLRSNDNIQPHDLILIHHEAYESELMATGMQYEEAHAIAAEKFDYKKALDAFLKNNDLG